MGVYIEFKYVFYALGIFFIFAVILFLVISYLLREPDLDKSFEDSKKKQDENSHQDDS